MFLRQQIHKLRGEDNLKVTDQEGLCTMARDYFDHLFQAQQGIYDHIIDLVKPKILQEDTDFLAAPFSEKEFKEALFQMHPDKVPSSDGLNPAFYQLFWNLCSSDVVQAACSWLQNGVILDDLNGTDIVLIPKVDVLESMRDLRPISLCNMVFKILSKVLANKLKKALPKCISVEQSTFTEGRSILDNAFIAS